MRNANRAERKATADAKQRGVTFEAAKSAFVDERTKLIGDPDHSRTRASITHYKAISDDVGSAYQSLINLCRRDCAASHRKLSLNRE